MTLWKGQRANRGYPISNNPQTFRNAENALWLLKAGVIRPFDPLQLLEEAITWRVTSAWADKRKKMVVRGAEQEGRRTLSHVSLIEALRQSNLQIWDICSFFFRLRLSTLTSHCFIWFVYLPLGELFVLMWVWIQGQSPNETLKSCLRLKEKQNTAALWRSELMVSLSFGGKSPHTDGWQIKGETWNAVFMGTRWMGFMRMEMICYHVLWLLQSPDLNPKSTVMGDYAAMIRVSRTAP